MTEHKSYTYFPDPGPCWFLVWLLLLNTLYVCFNSESVEFALPSMYSLSLWGLLLGNLLCCSVFHINVLGSSISRLAVVWPTATTTATVIATATAT